MPKEPSAVSYPSVDEAIPEEEGGPIARSGFNYQDEIAVSFLIEMLESPSLLKVHCETHDDVLLVYAKNDPAIQIAEFVQVKSNEPDQLWSVASICTRSQGKDGSSIFERSIARDKHCELSRFRLVTLRPVVKALKILTFPIDSPGREPSGDRFKALKLDLETRFPDITSNKGNGTDYWLQNCFWDERHSEKAVCNDNLLRLLRLSIEEERGLLPETAELILNELRYWAKAAGDAKWVPDRDQKIITHDALRDWWQRRTSELMEDAATVSGGRLRQKMSDAGLPSEIFELAADLRRGYAATGRASRYMEPGEAERLKGRVKSEVMSLQGQFVAGELNLNGAEFHSLCLQRMADINAHHQAGSEDRSAFLQGCMYDIADRCLLRFARPAR